MLLALQRRVVDLAAGRDLGGDGLHGAVAQRGGGLGSLIEKGDEARTRYASRGSGFGDGQDRLLRHKNHDSGHTEACSGHGVKSEIAGKG